MEYVYSVIGLFLANAVLILWMRAESRSDWRKSDSDNKELRRDMIEIMRSIDQEIKDFHGRLCSLESNKSK